ncbi:MAG TPA: hypothetical protein VMI31_10415, partial [Fimbriimonadaceae bacterium]|nr:hypothetical protein [Fimbriimonadaceae bacterium]
VGGRSDHLLGPLRSIRESFCSDAGDVLLWSVLGLAVSLPRRFTLSGRQFHAGKTELAFSGSGCGLVCTRWGFAEQLLEKYELGEWAKAALDMRSASLVERDGDLRLSGGKPWLRHEALVSFQPEKNQVVTLKASGRGRACALCADWVIR